MIFGLIIKKNNTLRPIQKNKIITSYLDGPKVEILGEEKQKYFIEFIDKTTSSVVYDSTIENGMWSASGKKYFIPWQIKINGIVHENLELKNKTVLISMESKSLGDTIAWAPYAVEFQKEHDCNVILSTFHNDFFKKLKPYSKVKFINPGESVNCDALYRIGWFRKDGKWGDYDRNPTLVNTIPLQQTATDILGLEYKEVNHGLYFEKGNRPTEKKYVVFAPNATSGCKEWVYENWVELSKLILEKGYEVFSLTKYPHHIPNVKNLFDENLSVVMNYLYHAEKFIGLGSGLSWLNWGMGKHTYMINGFSKPGHEFNSNITRIYNENTCISCWNDEVFTFDSGDWDWCPVYKGTKKQHICQKSITPNQVFEKLGL